MGEINEIDINDLKRAIIDIKARNARVELDKAWELSWTRKFLILALTYAVVVIFCFVTKIPSPFINAIVPTIAFVISTLSLSVFKGWWIGRG